MDKERLPEAENPAKLRNRPYAPKIITACQPLTFDARLG
jgi:hypothetical protein